MDNPIIYIYTNSKLYDEQYFVVIGPLPIFFFFFLIGVCNTCCVTWCLLASPTAVLSKVLLLVAFPPLHYPPNIMVSRFQLIISIGEVNQFFFVRG